MERVLITGAAGFVGKYLAKYYVENGDYEVFGTVLDDDDYVYDGVNVVEMNLFEPLAVDNVIKNIKPDIVIHLAAQSSVKKAWDNPTETMLTNVIGTIYLLDALKRHSSDSKILLVGSAEEYGSSVKSLDIVKEDDKCIPENIYAISKYTQGQIGRLYAKAYGMNIVMTRSFNHTGPMQSPTFVVSDFCKQVAMIENGNQEPVIRVGNLSAYRDFTDVRDVVEAYYLLIKYGHVGETYNVATGVPLKIEGILNKIISMSSTNIRVEIDQNKFRPTEVPKICPDVSKIKNDTGWTPKINIEETISEVLDYWRSEVKSRNR